MMNFFHDISPKLVFLKMIFQLSKRKSRIFMQTPDMQPRDLHGVGRISIIIHLKKKTFGKFFGVLHSNKEKCKMTLPSIFAASLGYGGFFPVESRWKSIHTALSDFEVADHVILHFLYNSEAKSGMTRETAMKIFRRWLSSDYVKKYAKLPIK